jgi:hypothetical protein
MTVTVALRQDFQPAGGLLRALEPSDSAQQAIGGPPRALGPADFAQLDRRLHDRIELEKLQTEVKKDLAELKNEESRLAQHSEQPAPGDLDQNWLDEAAEKAREKHQQVEAQFRPVIAGLKKKLWPPSDEVETEIQQLLRDSVEVLEGWVAFYERFHAMLAKQAAERRNLPEVIRARPIEGEINYAELSREHIARYPNIRARLAE